MSAAQLPISTSASEPQRRAIAHLFEEFERARVERDAAEARLARFAETLGLLIAGLPRRERLENERRLQELQGGSGIDPRGGETHNNVINLFTRERRSVWTISDVQIALEKHGISTDPKSVYNSIAYLARTGRLQRVGRGKYVVRNSGCGVEGEDHDDGTIRRTEHDV